MKQKRFSLAWTILVSAVLCLMDLACGGGSAKTNQPLRVLITSPASGPSVDATTPQQSVTFTASVVNDSSNQGVTWSLQTAFGKPLGALGNVSPTGATYTAPASVTSQSQVSVVATSVTDTTASATIAVVINLPPQIAANTSPMTGPCPPAGTVIAITGQAPYQHAWTTGSLITYDIPAPTGGVPPYTWTVSSGTLPSGLSLAVDPVNNQMSITGTATSSTCANVTMQATDAAGVSVSAPFYVLVLPPALSVQPPPISTAYAGVLYPLTALKAVGGVAPYTWSEDPNSPLPLGLNLSSPPQNPNIAVISGTPPSDQIPLFNTADVFVHDSQSPYPAAARPSANVGFPLGGAVLDEDHSCHAGLEANLASTQGPYTFLLRGFDASGPVVIAGNFTVDGTGAVTGGVEDINRSSGPQANVSITGGSYTVGTDNHGCLTLTTGSSMTFHTAFGACSTSANAGTSGGCQNSGYFTRGRILLDDSTSGIRATGIIRLQDSSTFTNSGLSGLYAFGLSGKDSAGRYAVAGSLSANSGGFRSIAADINDAGALSSNLTGGSGAYAIASSGRGTATMTVGSATFNMAVYVISSSEAIFATTDAFSASRPILGGEARSATGSFAAAALQNTYMLRMTGLSSGASDANIGLLTFDGLSSATGTIYENNGGTLGTTALSGNYAVDGNSGRLTLSAPLQSQNLGSHPIVAYVANAGKGVSAFLVSTDSAAQAGVLQFQIENPPLSTFTNASLIGPTFISTDEDADSSTTNFLGTAFLNGNAGFSGSGLTLDGSYPATTGPLAGPLGLVLNDLFTASYSVAHNGTGTFGGQTVSVTNGSTVFSLDESPLDLNPTITVVEQ